MTKKIYLIAAILTAIVAASLLVEIIGEIYNNNFSDVGLKKILYLFGNLTLSIVLFYRYSDKSKQKQIKNE